MVHSADGFEVDVELQLRNLASHLFTSGDMALIVQEGEVPQKAMEILGASDNEFDVSFKGQVKDIHGLDLSQPLPGPLPELYIDYMQPMQRRGLSYDLPDFNA